MRRKMIKLYDKVIIKSNEVRGEVIDLNIVRAAIKC